VKIHYIDAGRGPAMLFVPGWTISARIWEPQIAYFSATHRVIAMDPRGQGDSDKPTDGYYPAARARDIKAVVDELRLAPVVLIGWSMAVAEVASYVEQFGTSTLSAVVLVDGIAGTDPNPGLTASMVNFVGAMQTDRAKTTDGFVRSMYRTSQREDYLAGIIADSLKMPTSAAVAVMVGTITTDARAGLAKIDKPVLLATAPGGPWTAVYQDMQARMRGCRVVSFDGAGHALFVDQAAKFNTEVEALLRQ
jgi:microsomal epoxide hydrolase